MFGWSIQGNFEVTVRMLTPGCSFKVASNRPAEHDVCVKLRALQVIQCHMRLRQTGLGRHYLLHICTDICMALQSQCSV